MVNNEKNRAGEIFCLLIHGMGGSPEEFRELEGFLNSREIITDAPSLFRFIKKDDIIGSIQKSIRDDLNEVNMQKIFLVGHSLGGLLSASMAMDYELDGLVLMSTPGVYDLDNIKSFLETYKETFTAIKIALRKWDVMEAYIHEVEKLWEKINIPVLVIQGRRDRLVSTETAQNIYNKIGTENKEIIILEKGSHNFLTFGSKTNSVYNDIFNFINKHT